jgi:hypothetical protein
MTKQTTFGKFQSITIFDREKKQGEIILRTDTGNLTLGLSNDSDKAFAGMASVACAGVEFASGTPGAPPNIHVEYDDKDMEVDEMTLHYH